MALGGLTGGAALLGQPHARPGLVLTVLAPAAVVGALTVRHLRTTPGPLLALDLLATRTFRAAQQGGSVFRAAMQAGPFLLPLLFQDELGWSAARAGGVVLLLFVGNLLVKPATTLLLHRLGFRRTLVLAARAGC